MSTIALIFDVEYLGNLEIEAWFQRTANRMAWANGHVTDDVNNVIPIRLDRHISKTAGDRDTVPKDRQWPMGYGYQMVT